MQVGIVTYIEDLSPYVYADKRVEGELLCVGWLDVSHDYPTGPTSEGFRVALLKLCIEEQVAKSRGFHQCNLPPCDRRPAWPPVSVSVSGRELHLGSAEIRVAASRGIGFAAPDLIYHYVVAHGYKPPAQFVQSVQEHVIGP